MVTLATGEIVFLSDLGAGVENDETEFRNSKAPQLLKDFANQYLTELEPDEVLALAGARAKFLPDFRNAKADSNGGIFVPVDGK